MVGPLESQPRPPMGGRSVVVANRRRREISAHSLRPGFLDPIGGGGGFVVAMPRLRPIGWRRDIADRNSDDSIGVPSHERIFRIVLAESGDRSLVTLVIVRANVEVA